MTTISAESVLASSNGSSRIDTMVLRYPRIIHAELLTHRVFSRNSASSRAIPVEKMIQSVLDDPFVPLFWGSEQRGMQAGDECDNYVDVFVPCKPSGGTDYPGWLNLTPEMVDDTDQPVTLENAACVHRVGAWLAARDQAVIAARNFAKAGYHKQIANRLLEPFSHITIVLTSTEWDNFFALRDHPDAEPHMRMLAQAIRSARDGADVQELSAGQWHLPFVSEEEKVAIWLDDLGGPPAGWNILHHVQKLSVARCASVSYKTVEGFDMTPERANGIYAKLIEGGHWSPFEHQAQVEEYWDDLEGRNANFRMGWFQLRHTMETK